MKVLAEAYSSAPRTRSVSHGPSTRQPTTRSENASRTAANQNLPLPAGDPGRIGHLQAVRARRGEVQDHRVRRRRRRQILRGRPRPPLAAQMGVLKPAWPITRSIRLRPTASSTNSTSTSTSCGRRSPRTSPNTRRPPCRGRARPARWPLIATPWGRPIEARFAGPGCEGVASGGGIQERTAAGRCPWSQRCPPQRHRNCTSTTTH